MIRLGHGWAWMLRLHRYQKRWSAGFSARCGISSRSLAPLNSTLARITSAVSTIPISVTAGAEKATPTKIVTTRMPTDRSAARDVLSMRAPTQPNSAGSRVSEAITISSTPTAEATATPVTNLRPISDRPSRAMITVVPAKITARPLVSRASAIESSTVDPAWSASRYLVTMNRA